MEEEDLDVREQADRMDKVVSLFSQLEMWLEARRTMRLQTAMRETADMEDELEKRALAIELEMQALKDIVRLLHREVEGL